MDLIDLKMVFIVDNFTGHGVGDVTDNDYSISMDMAKGELRPAHHHG